MDPGDRSPADTSSKWVSKKSLGCFEVAGGGEFRRRHRPGGELGEEFEQVLVSSGLMARALRVMASASSKLFGIEKDFGFEWVIAETFLRIDCQVAASASGLPAAVGDVVHSFIWFEYSGCGSGLFLRAGRRFRFGCWILRRDSGRGRPCGRDFAGLLPGDFQLATVALVVFVVADAAGFHRFDQAHCDLIELVGRGRGGG